MAEKYLTTIAKLACSIAGLSLTPKNINMLLPMAWKGLNIDKPDQVVTTWSNMSDAEKKSMGNKIKEIDINPVLNNLNFKCSNNP